MSHDPKRLDARVAIVGMAGRFPDASTLDEFWANLASGRESLVEFTDEEILKMFHTQTDFSERIARYQVQHISGSRGGKKKYTPPSCKTMKTHSLCINPDQLCATIAHPLAYYRKKARTITVATRRQRTTQAPKPISS